MMPLGIDYAGGCSALPVNELPKIAIVRLGSKNGVKNGVRFTSKS